MDGRRTLLIENILIISVLRLGIMIQVDIFKVEFMYNMKSETNTRYNFQLDSSLLSCYTQACSGLVYVVADVAQDCLYIKSLFALEYLDKISTFIFFCSFGFLYSQTLLLYKGLQIISELKMEWMPKSSAFFIEKNIILKIHLMLNKNNGNSDVPYAV